MIGRLKMATLDFLYTDKTVGKRRQALINEVKSPQVAAGREKRQLLVDVSVIIKSDVRTGIQRVVRAILSELLSSPPNGYSVRPVFADAAHSYHYAPEDFDLANDNATLDFSLSKRVNVDQGDVFLALDLATQQLSKYQDQLERWKRKGVAIHVMVYDLLPVLHPEWFHSRTTRNFYRWLRALAVVADSAICVSNSVKDDLIAWLKTKYRIPGKSLPIKIIPMGCDFEASVPNYGMPDIARALLQKFSENPTAIMVGTLEPRKGHQHVLDAFEFLWRQGHDINLLIVGKRGWKTNKLQSLLEQHPERNVRLFWLENVSDEFLLSLYQVSCGLIMASEAEGYGLPIIEALANGKLVVARDLPVFREITSPNLMFFDTHNISRKLPNVLLEMVQKKRDEVEIEKYSCGWNQVLSVLYSALGIAWQQRD